MGSKSTEELVKEIQGTGGVAKEKLFADLISRMDGAIYRLSVSMGATQPYIDGDDRRAMLLEVLWKCCEDYDGRAKFITMFWAYARRQKIELWKAHQTNSRKIGWMDACPLEEVVMVGREESGFGEVEMLDCIERFPITEKEKEFLKLTIRGDGSTDVEKAIILNVSSSAVTHFKKSIAKKIRGEW
jgi:hypothetical protein